MGQPRQPLIPKSNIRGESLDRGAITHDFAPWAKNSGISHMLDRKAFWAQLSEESMAFKLAYKSKRLLGLVADCRGRLGSLMSTAQRLDYTDNDEYETDLPPCVPPTWKTGDAREGMTRGASGITGRSLEYLSAAS